MNCGTARALIDSGVEPGSTTPIRTALGFHLAQCEACRAYKANAKTSLLASLLTEAPRVAPKPTPRPQTRAQPRFRPKRRRGIGLAIGGVVVLALLWLFAPSVWAIFRIHQDYRAMVIPTAQTRQRTTELAPVLAVVPTPAHATQVPTAVSAQHAIQPAATHIAPSAVPATAAAEAPVPTQTITPVPLDAILSVSRGQLAQPATQNRSNQAAKPGSDKAITVLLMGVDRRPGESGGTRADTIMIARLDPERKRIAMLSLPRDLIVPIPGYGYARINAANVYGESDSSPGGGLELTRKTVANLLGIPIDYVAQVDFQGFIGVVDAIGGVDIDVPTEIYDAAYPTMDYGYTVAHFLPGKQHMDGERALMYARTRHADSDFGRMRRQQLVLLGVLQRVREQNMVQQLQSIADVTSALRGYIETDLPEDKMISLAWTFRGVSPSSVERYALDENSIQVGVLADDPYAEFALPGAIEQLSNELINGPAQPADGQ